MDEYVRAKIFQSRFHQVLKPAIVFSLLAAAKLALAADQQVIYMWKSLKPNTHS
jgi:hypothetical protein